MAFSPTYIDLYAKSRCGNTEAFQELGQMSTDGDNLAKGYYAMIYQRSSIITIPRNEARATQLLEELIDWLFQVEHEDVYNAANVWYLLGFCYYEAIGVKKQDKERAVHFYQLSFDRGHALAQCALGNCYDVGEGVKQNIPKALTYYELSADQGFPVAQSNVGMCYEFGEGCRVDLDKAFKFADMAAEQGYVDALYNLAMYYFYGKGVDIDPVKGIEYCRRGADLGDLECLYIMGDCYLRGYCVSIDDARGFEFIHAAASRGHEVSMIYAAECYQEGRGVAADIIEAVRMLRRVQKSQSSYMAQDTEKQLAQTLLDEFKDEYKAQVTFTHFYSPFVCSLPVV